jgi:hypothetical protein
MRLKLSALIAGALSLALAPALAQAQPPAVAAQNDQAVSVGQTAMVKVVRHTGRSKDPLSKYGAGFFVVVYNKSGQPVEVGPDSILVKDANGQVLHLLTVERLAELKQQEANRAQAVGALFAVGVGMLGGAAAARTQDPAAAAQMMATSQTDAMLIMKMSEDHAAAIASEQDALVAAYTATPFNDTSVAPLAASSGRVVVDGIKDRDPAVIIVTVAGEPHEIDFPPAGR